MIGRVGEIMLVGSRSIWMLIANFYPGIGGAERQAQMVSEAMIARNWSVQVITRRHSFSHSRGLSADDEINGIRIIRLFSRGGSKLGSAIYMLSTLWHLSRHGRNGIYHAHDIGSVGWVAVIARYLLGGRCVIKLRTGRLYYTKQFSSRLWRWHFSALLRLADQIIVVNREVERLVKELGIPGQKVIHISNTVDTHIFNPASSEEKLGARLRLGIPIDRTIVLYVGRLMPVKGVDVLLDAWSLLPLDVRHKAQLVVVGDGADHGKLQTMVRTFGIQDSVLFTGASRLLSCRLARSEFLPMSRRRHLAQNQGGYGLSVDCQSRGRTF